MREIVANTVYHNLQDTKIAQNTLFGQNFLLSLFFVHFFRLFFFIQIISTFLLLVLIFHFDHL